MAWFFVRENFFLSRNPRYQRLDKAIREAFERAQEAAPATFVLELKTVSAGTNLKGGEVEL
ncbi:MAG: hypothetical protein C5B50_25240 [Verrucomicrobia bacterium]|nr:MAG: hypothetical protein C5B50_25240 [Verrucomicrobiota bacterium]